ncbi:4-hydroxy-2-oxovalerate aldolase [Lachnospiraceae bacterium ZAX-1]
MSKIKIFDSTIRDGSHAIAHQLTENNIEEYCQAMDDSGIYALIVGHGNGLGASSLQVGLSLLPDDVMLTIARDNLKNTKLGAYMIPGFGTIEDNLIPAVKIGVDVFKIGCHCTEADTTRQHIEYLRDRNKETYGILMMYHMASVERVLEEARKMQSYGANGVILMDSAGASTPEMVKRVISTLYSSLNIKIGFHAHNNLGLAIGNSYIALQEGAEIIDGTLRGFGAGAGNCQLEAFLALLEKNAIYTGVDFKKVLGVSNDIMPQIMKQDMGLDSLSIVSGMSGVFSAFKLPVQRAAKEFDVDPIEIFKELGMQRAIGGQEDMIIEVAEKLSKPFGLDNVGYHLSSLL